MLFRSICIDKDVARRQAGISYLVTLGPRLTSYPADVNVKVPRYSKQSSYILHCPPHIRLQSNLYISILYISITSVLALTLLARFWDYGYDSILKTSKMHNLFNSITPLGPEAMLI